MLVGKKLKIIKDCGMTFPATFSARVSHHYVLIIELIINYYHLSFIIGM